MTDSPVRPVVCGQDHLRPYRNVLDEEQFLLCPECDSVWLPGEDTSRWVLHDLDDLFADRRFLPGEVAWDFIEPVLPD